MVEIEPAGPPPRREAGDIETGSMRGAGTRGGGRGRGARLGHTVLLALTLVLQWLARDYLDARLVNASPALQAECGSLEGDAAAECHAAEMVLRVSFGASIFFAALTMLTFRVSDVTSWRGRLHNGWWLAKVIVLVGTVCASVFGVSADAANAYGQLARVGGGAFLMFQWIILLATVYNINDWMLREDVWEGAGRFLLPLGTFITYGAGLALVGFAFHVFAPSGSCSLNIGIVSICLLFGAVHVFLSLKAQIEHAGLFTSACVFAYMAFLTVSALGAEPDAYRCNTLKDTNEDGERTVGWSEVVSFVIAFGTVFVSAFTAGGRRDAFRVSKESGSDDVAKGVLEDDRPQYSYAFSNFALVLSSMYGSMLLLSWQLGTTQGVLSIQDGWAAMWVQVVSGWLGGLLYMWSLLAPVVFPDRTFE